jgi:hypothetical protein
LDVLRLQQENAADLLTIHISVTSDALAEGIIITTRERFGPVDIQVNDRGFNPAGAPPVGPGASRLIRDASRQSEGLARINGGYC